jgi:hypothetical protein
MAKRKKKPTVYQQHALFYWQQQQWTAPMSESYPDVASITIDVKLTDPDGWAGNPAPTQLTFTPDQKAFFQMQCPYRECVRGGFDFSKGVSQAVADPAGRSAGYELCNGWQDEERIGKHSCMLRADYNITVQRRDASPKSPNVAIPG